MAVSISRNRLVYAALLVWVVAVPVCGCGNRTESPAAVTAGGAASAPSPTKDAAVKKFLAELESQPVEKRKAFVDGHQSEAVLVTQSGDPQHAEKFYTLMMPKMAMPQNP